MNTPPRHQMPPGAPYPDDMIQQAEEQQSIYRDPSAPGLHEYEPDGYHNPNPRKRVNTEASDNPKKRAAVAVSPAILALMHLILVFLFFLLIFDSAMYAVEGSPNATAVNHGVGCVLNSAYHASIRSLV